MILPMLQELYVYFLTNGKCSRQALLRFYMRDVESREFVRIYAVKGKKFYGDFMSMRLEELKGPNKYSRGSFNI